MRLGVDVRTAIPLHAVIDRKLIPSGSPITVEVSHPEGEQAAEVYRAESRGVPTLLIDGLSIRAATRLYGEPASDMAKFAFFCLAALHACRLEGWAPDIVHANDWHTAPALLWLLQKRNGDDLWRDTATIMTIHNLGYMGAGGERALRDYGLIPPPDARLPRWARTLPLPLGLAAADWITTVSPTYAQEIQTQELGAGLDGFLRQRSDRLTGILNGLDQAVWDPRTDPALPAGFDAGDPSPRSACKRALQTELGLPDDESVPVIGMVTRLDPQKGVDLVLEALPMLESDRWQFVLLGSGQEELEQQVVAFAGEHADRARSIQRYDAPLSRRIFGGADMLLVPSRYEPCGLTQAIACSCVLHRPHRPLHRRAEGHGRRLSARRSRHRFRVRSRRTDSSGGSHPSRAGGLCRSTPMAWYPTARHGTGPLVGRACPALPRGLRVGATGPTG